VEARRHKSRYMANNIFGYIDEKIEQLVLTLWRNGKNIDEGKSLRLFPDRDGGSVAITNCLFG
jgi:hypothetical protein